MSSEPSSTTARRGFAQERFSADEPVDSLRVRHTTPQDFEDILRIGRLTYPHESPWKANELQQHLERFPDGQFVVVDGRDRVLGMAATQRMAAEAFVTDPTWSACTGGGTLSTHDPGGDILYAVEVMVDPAARGRGVGKRLYRARRALAHRLPVHGIWATARMRGYHRHVDTLSAKEYIDAVVRGDIGDPTISFQLRQGFKVVTVVRDFLADPETLGYAAVIRWDATRRARTERGALLVDAVDAVLG